MQPLTLCLLLVLQNADLLDSSIIYDRDFDYEYFGFKVCAHCLSLPASAQMLHFV